MDFSDQKNRLAHLGSGISQYIKTHPELVAALSAPVVGAGTGVLLAEDPTGLKKKSMKRGAMIGGAAGAGIIAYKNREELKKLIYNILGPREQ